LNEVDGIPHLCLLASEHLSRRQQVLYNYGVKVPSDDLVSFLQLMFSVFGTFLLQAAVQGHLTSAACTIEVMVKLYSLTCDNLEQWSLT